MTLKSIIKRGISYMGYKIQRNHDGLGQNAFRDMHKLSITTCRPVIFDVGANVGQSIEMFHSCFDQPIIHAFEPGTETFIQLQRRVAGIPDVHLNNYALGSKPGVSDFMENTNSLMSSFLEPGLDCWGTIQSKRPVEIKTIDDYCQQHGIPHFDILKTDTQGFDLDVLRGAENLLAVAGIHLILLEITFSDIYKKLPRLDEIYAFLSDRGFLLVSFYQFEYLNDRASWTDALFINPRYKSTFGNDAQKHASSHLVDNPT